VLYLTEPASSPAIFAVVIDLAARRVTEARWHEVPPNDTGLVPPDDIARIDAAIRKHGDFGVYGNITGGLTSLLAHSSISMARAPGRYAVSVEPRSGEGHKLSFTVVLATGALEGVAAGHIVHPDR